MIIGAELESCKRLKYFLQDNKTSVYYALTQADGLRHLMQYGYQLVALDISRNIVHFMEEIRKIRLVPIIVLWPIEDTTHAVEMLSVADDFLQKSFDTEICRVQIKALLRRFPYGNSQNVPSVLSQDGTLMIYGRSRKVYVLNIEIILPHKQYELLYLMASNEGQIFTRRQLYQNI